MGEWSLTTPPKYFFSENLLGEAICPGIQQLHVYMLCVFQQNEIAAGME